ncbi:hypothetical protein [Altererythrobacter ishigakiensis]|uniref:Uncharacterized protein n=1 Tax=Altererythrobacter ishigakiensis TaxID=476157 RepID=A0A562UUC5_9SPHN|nr:hypothetical protein [Altererythrobacter ishigakiensis]TWJ09219.1 hypothetical protein JN10_0846 [Altererythrobacter ishigakiensis]
MYSKILAVLAATVVFTAIPTEVQAQSWEVRREIREGNREVARERREAAREILSCKTRKCAEREYREANREVARERREARREVMREIREDYYDRFYRGNGRWWRDGRYWNRNDYLRRYYARRDNDGADVLKGALVGAAVVGIIAAVTDDD